LEVICGKNVGALCILEIRATGVYMLRERWATVVGIKKGGTERKDKEKGFLERGNVDP